MTKLLLAAAAAIAGLVVQPAAAQDAPLTVDLPAICKPAMHHDMGGGMEMMGMMGMGAAYDDLAKGMAETNAQMMQAMQAEDIDVAFVCAMIPHHQAAINMAKAELAHGDNDWAKGMAQKVIDAQQQEIADMLAWLAEQK